MRVPSHPYHERGSLPMRIDTLYRIGTVIVGVDEPTGRKCMAVPSTNGMVIQELTADEATQLGVALIRLAERPEPEEE